MRASRRFLHGFTASLALASLGLVGCSKDSNGPDGNNADPTADFTSACTDMSCSFTDLSSDGDGTVASFQWEFGDGEVSTTRDPSHAFASPGQYSVKLTVTDNAGGNGSVTKSVTATAALAGAPTAAFSVSCASLDCTFQDQSTDADGTIAAWAWNFGDGQNSADQNPAAHHYAATGRTVYDVSLTVTDNAGLTSVTTEQITVSPPASLQCVDAAPGHSGFASCDLVLEADARVTVKLEDRSCDAHGDKFRITAPILETLFADGCYTPAVGTSFAINGGAVFAAGTHLQADVVSGATNQQTAPALHVSGAYPTWTLSFDDGVGGAHEPDFNDLVMTVTATPAQ